MRKSYAVLVGLVVWAILLILIFYKPEPAPTLCTMEAKICDDGTTVGRVPPTCKFADCPRPYGCDAKTPCQEGQGQCVLFSWERTGVCYKGDPCQRCPTGRCQVLDSDPIQVRCQ